MITTKSCNYPVKSCYVTTQLEKNPGVVKFTTVRRSLSSRCISAFVSQRSRCEFEMRDVVRERGGRGYRQVMKSFLRRQGDFGTALKRLRSLFASPLKVAQEVVHRERVSVVREWKRVDNYEAKDQGRKTRKDTFRRKENWAAFYWIWIAGRVEEGNKLSHVTGETTLKIKQKVEVQDKFLVPGDIALILFQA